MGKFIRNKSKRVSGSDKQKELVINTNLKIENNFEVDIPGRKSLKSKIAEPIKPTQIITPIKKEVVIKKTVTSTFNEGTKPESRIFRETNDIIPKTKDKNFNKVNNIDENGVDIILNNELNKSSIQLSFMDLVSFKDFIKGKSIALIANSSDLLNYKNGSEIDAHDIVIRFNSFKIDSIHTGEKTTIHASIYLQDINMDYFVPIRIVVSTNILKWVNKLKSINKFNQTFILKYNHPSIFNLIYNRKPLTTGLNILITLLKLGGFDKIDLYGFTFYKDWNNSILRTDGGLSLGISSAHDYDFEKTFIFNKLDEYNEDKNVITFYGNSTL